MATATAKAKAKITPRQREILMAYAMGERTAEIAARLGITRATVASTIEKVKQRLGARTVTNAVIIAYDEKLIP